MRGEGGEREGEEVAVDNYSPQTGYRVNFFHERNPVLVNCAFKAFRTSGL